MSVPTFRPSHAGICVRDLPGALRFWRDGLGFDVAHSYDLTTAMVPGLGPALEVADPVRLTSTMLKLGELTVELLAYASPAVSGRPSATRGQLGLTHLSFLVPDVDVAAAHLVQHGGTVVETTRQDLGIAVVFLADPDGTRVELMQG